MVPEVAEESMQRPSDRVKNDEDQNEESLRLNYLFTAKVMMIAGAVGSFIVFVISVVALQKIYQFYPQFVAQQWFTFDEAFAIFTFLGVLFGFTSSFTSSRRNLTVAFMTGVVSTVSGAAVFVTSLIAPLAIWWRSILFYFVPLFLAPLIGTLLVYYVMLADRGPISRHGP